MSDGLDDLAHDNFACFVHERVSNAIGHMDAKASIMLGLTSGALIYLAGEFDIVTQWMALPSGSLFDGIAIVSVMALIASVLLASSFMLSVSCVWPRSGQPKNNLLFFSAISRFPSGDAYAGAVTGTRVGDLVSAVLADTHAISKIARRKMSLVMWSTWLFVLGVIVTLAAALIKHI